MHLPGSYLRRRAGAGALIGAVALTPFASSAATVAPGTRTAATAAAPRCTTADLVTWLNTSGSGTAGGEYYDLELTNISGRACTLSGYPGVSAINTSGHQLGSAASRNAAHAPAVITLASGRSAAGLPPVNIQGTAMVVLKITDVGVYAPSECGPVTAAGLRVYPPNQTRADVVPFPFVACSHAGPNFLTVEAVQKAVFR